MKNRPWTLLNPNEYTSMWWKQTEIINVELYDIRKSLDVSLAHFIIQDGNMGGNFWHVCSWYINDPNRYSTIYYPNNWPFNKPLTDMSENETVYLINNPNVKFIVSLCKFSLPEQTNFCKILQRKFT